MSEMITAGIRLQNSKFQSIQEFIDYCQKKEVHLVYSRSMGNYLYVVMDGEVSVIDEILMEFIGKKKNYWFEIIAAVIGAIIGHYLNIHLLWL